MAFPAGQAVENIERSSDESKSSGTKKLEGPPPAHPKPRPATDSSLYSTVGKSAMDAGSAGLGGEGSDPAVIGLQGLALVQRGVQMLNLAFPENPGLPAVLGDIIGRLQNMIPQLAAQSANQGMGLLSNMSSMISPMGMQPPGMGGMANPMMGAPTGPMGPPQPGMPMPPGQMPPQPPMQ